jgi:hypothetical protein
VPRRSFATHNQKQLKNVQAHLGHESTGATADLYVEEIPEEVRRTQERYAAEIDALRELRKSSKAEKKSAVRKRSTPKLDATGCKLSKAWRKLFDFHGERGRTRTCDPCLKRALLYQLSYAPTLCILSVAN